MYRCISVKLINKKVGLKPAYFLFISPRPEGRGNSSLKNHSIKKANLFSNKSAFIFCLTSNFRHQTSNILVSVHFSFEGSFNRNANIFSLLMLSFIAVSTTYIFGTLLTANGNLKQLNFMAATGMILNIVFNYILIKKYQAYGSAMSSMTTQFFTAIVQVFIAQRIFKFKVNFRLLNSFAIFAIGVIAINYYSKMIHVHWFEFNNWMVSFSIMCFGCAIWAFVTGMISIKAMFRILKFG